MRNIKFGIKNCGNGCGMVGKIWNAEKVHKSLQNPGKVVLHCVLLSHTNLCKRVRCVLALITMIKYGVWWSSGKCSATIAPLSGFKS